MKSMIFGALLALCCAALVPGQALANGGVCPRPAVGGEIAPPPDLFSSNGTLETALNYFTSVDDEGRTLFCFVTPDGNLSPTLHVNPGDQIKIHLTNMIPASPGGRSEVVSNDAMVCGNKTMTDTSVNMHFHGMNVTPGCHGDEVIHTLVNSGKTLRLPFPRSRERAAGTLLVSPPRPRPVVDRGAGRRHRRHRGRRHRQHPARGRGTCPSASSCCATSPGSAMCST